jgi:4-amino-4-deoxy-L-arabinose transferase-like glycosyltransferase
MPVHTRNQLLLAALATAFFVPFLGGVHLFDWDEINFAEISREMLITGEYTRVYINFSPFWEKPPFFFWLQALAMRLFGVGEFAARFPNAICGVLTLLILYRIGAKLYSARFGLLWAGAYFGSVLPFLYFKSGIIDPFFNLFIFLGLYFFILFYWKKEGAPGISLSKNRWVYLFLGGFFIGMGILTKGQVAFLIAALTMGVYWVYHRFRLYVHPLHFAFFTLCAALVTLAWYGLETWKNGPWFINEFNRYQYRLFSTPDAGHRGFPGYHFVVLLLGCFPASVFALRAFFRLPEENHDFQADFRRWMKFLFWTVLILFTIVKSKIVHYSSMCYFPLTFLAALSLDKWMNGQIALRPWLKTFLLSIGGLYIMLVVALPFLAMRIEWLKPWFASDPFAQANLDAQVRWTGWEATPGILLLLVLLSFFYLANREKRGESVIVLFGGTGIFVLLTLIFFIKRIEGYSQRSAVEFFSERAGEDCYISTYGYRSYAHLFYSRPRDGDKCCFQDQACTERLIRGAIDQPAYIVAKVNRAEELRAIPDLEEIGAKNGFVFFRRLP